MDLSGFKMSTFVFLGKWSSSEYFYISAFCTVLFLRMWMLNRCYCQKWKTCIWYFFCKTCKIL